MDFFTQALGQVFEEFEALSPQDSLHPYGIFLFSPWIPGNFQEQIFIVSPDLIILF